MIRLLMITHDRPRYTKLSLARLCETSPENVRITVWDNASAAETKDVLRQFESHPLVDRVIYHGRNEKLRTPTNWFWTHARDAELVGKVDDDCLVPERWIDDLTRAHRDVPEAGMLACWIYLPEDFEPEAAGRKTQTFGAHRILRNCWVGGSGYLMKRSVIERIGLLRRRESFTGYCVRAAARGFVNGWTFPFLWQEHMDDPRSEHCEFRTEADFARRRPLSAVTADARTLEEWSGRLKKSAHYLQTCSFEPEDYMGSMARFWHRLRRGSTAKGGPA